MNMRSNQGSSKLRRWLKEERRTQEWLAERVGSIQTTVSKWLHGMPIPLDKALAVRDITGIAVEDWTVPADEESGALQSDETKAAG